MKHFTDFFSPSLLQKIFLLVLIVFISSAAFAQDEVKCHRYGGFARLHAMGDNPYIIDPDNIKTNPAYSAMYPNFLWGDIGEPAYWDEWYDNPETGYGQFVGFNFAVNKELTLGILLTRNDFQTFSIGMLDPSGLLSEFYTGVGPYLTPLDNNIELLGAYNLGNVALGLGVAYASTSFESKPATGTGDKKDASQIGFNLGAQGNLSPTFGFDAGFSMIMLSAAYEPGDTLNPEIDASNTMLLFNARGFLKLNNKFTLVPAFGFYSASGEVEVNTEKTDLPSAMGIMFGVGLTYQVGNLIISGGPSLWYETRTYAAVADENPELEDSWFTFPAWNLGAEWYFTDWLIGRAGYVASTYSGTYQSPASTTTVNEYTYTGFERGDVRLGVGFRFGQFSLDATVNDDALRHGFNLIGGGIRSFGYLSASYAF